MVKVGILTYHRSLNYGAVMQAYYLAEEIKKRFPDVSVEIVDYMSKKMNRYYKMITLYRGKESLIHLRERIEMYKAFQKGWDELPLSDKKIISDDYEMVMKNINGKYGRNKKRNCWKIWKSRERSGQNRISRKQERNPKAGLEMGRSS